MLNNYLTIKYSELYIEQIKLHNYQYKNKLLNNYLTKYHISTSKLSTSTSNRSAYIQALLPAEYDFIIRTHNSQN